MLYKMSVGVTTTMKFKKEKLVEGRMNAKMLIGTATEQTLY